MTHINDDIEYVEDTIPATRNNLDKRETNAYGYAVLDLCKSSGLRILNCHFGKDTNIGHFTCITDNSVLLIILLLILTLLILFLNLRSTID